MKKLFVLFIAFTLWGCGDRLPDTKQAYAVTTDFVKKTYGGKYPGIKCPFSQYQADYLNDSSYIVMSHFTYIGSARSFQYKARLKWSGGKWSDINNWKLLYIEERVATTTPPSKGNDFDFGPI